MLWGSSPGCMAHAQLDRRRNKALNQPAGEILFGPAEIGSGRMARVQRAESRVHPLVPGWQGGVVGDRLR
jgi:hypothetical protein